MQMMRSMQRLFALMKMLIQSMSIVMRMISALCMMSPFWGRYLKQLRVWFSCHRKRNHHRHLLNHYKACVFCLTGLVRPAASFVTTRLHRCQPHHRLHHLRCLVTG
jgi:hypothetical protein